MDWQPLLGQAPGLSTGLLLAVGLVIGWASTASGLGAGLALPVLAAAGMPLPAALLSVKLPVALADGAATLAACRPGPAGMPCGLLTPACLLAAAAGGAAALAVLHLPAAWVVAAAPPLAALAWLQRRAAVRAGTCTGLTALAWGAYIGLCGMGASLLWRLGGGSKGSHATGPLQGGLAWRAAANGGAVVVLLAAGQQAGISVALLAAAQAVGACLAMRGPLALGRNTGRLHG